MIDLNATQAAIRAGYSEKTARSMGAENLTKPDIAAAIKAAQNKVAADNELSVEWVLSMLKQNAQRAMQVVPVLDSEGNEKGEYRYEGNVANKAMELLGKHLGMFADRSKVELSGPNGGPVAVEVREVIVGTREEAAAVLAALETTSGVS